MQSKKYAVLGATGGIGSELAKKLVGAGSQVVLMGRSEEKLLVLGSELGCQWVRLDASDSDQVERSLVEAAGIISGLDGVANCVGSILLKPAHLIKGEEWEEVIRTNLGSAFGTVKGAARVMRRSGGSVVLVSSAAARVGLPNHEAIAAAKAGIQGLALSAASTYASSRIRFNVVAPGLVKTPLTHRITSRPASEEASRSMHPLGRLGEPGDIASAIAWLLDPDQSWVTGQVIGVDGGLADLKVR